MANYPTPHIDAKPGDFGQTVLMPGDPLRAKFIAENFLQNAVLVNNVRGIQGYTGIYDGTKISVMASGMGMPSIGIYSWELYTVFGVENIMRIGSTGALQDSIKLRDIVIGQGACTDSNWASQYHLAGTFAPIADFHMLETCVETAKEMGVAYHVGNILSSDRFYGDDGDMPEGWQANYGWQKMGVLAVEMEAAGIQAVCDYHGLSLYNFLFASDCLEQEEWKNKLLGTSGEKEMQVKCFQLALHLAAEL